MEWNKKNKGKIRGQKEGKEEGGVSDMEFLAVRRAEGADVCHSFLVRLDRCGRVCQRNIEEVHVKVGRLHVFCVSGCD